MTTADAPASPPDKNPFTPRWKALVPTAAVLGGIVVFNVFFLDGLVKKSIEKAGTAANGARVDLDGASVSLLKTSVTFTRLQVTDADEPLTNALEIARLTFKLDPKPLAWKKIIIQDASLEGIRTGTRRKSSGAVARPAPKKQDDADQGPGMTDKVKTLGLESLGNLKDKYDPKKIQPEDLASYRKAKEEQVHWEAQASAWGSRLDAVKSADLDDRVKSLVERVKNDSFSGLEGVKKAQDYLKEAKAIKNDTEAAKNGFESLKKDLSGEISRAKESLRNLDSLRKSDVENALGDIKGAASVEGVTEGLLGPRYDQIRGWIGRIQKIRALIPEKKAEKKTAPPPSRRGVDIPFPFRHRWPGFHLVKAALAGETPGGLAYGGSLTDVTSEPSIVGRPAVLALTGEKNRRFRLSVSLDYTGDVPREKISFLYGEIKLDGMALGQAGAPVSIKTGAADTTGDIDVRGDTLTGTIGVTAKPLALEHALSADQAKNKLLSLLHDVLGRLDQADLTFHLSGRLASPAISVKSSLDEQIKDAVNQAVKKELDALKAQAAARVAELVDGEKKKLEDLVNGRGGDALKKMGLKDKQIAQTQAAIQKALDDLQKKGTASVIPAGDKLPGDLKKLFKKK